MSGRLRPFSEVVRAGAIPLRLKAEECPRMALRTRHFTHCAFGPYELRPLLRAKLLPGEVVVGWGAVERSALGPAKTLQIGLGMTPIVGPILAAMLTHPKHRFVVLTDSRVIVLDARARTRRGLHVIAETPIGTVRVASTVEKRVFRVALDEQDQAQAIGVPKQRGKGPERMLDALRILAREDARL